MNKCYIIPVPKKYERKGQFQCVAPFITTENPKWQPLIETFCQCALKIYQVSFTQGSGGIRLICNQEIEREAYVLDVEEEVRVEASDEQGCIYALATLLQLMNDQLELESVRIEDKPDKDYRGLMIDLARKWFPFNTLLHYVDICFFYKVKYLHLHFMDDQSYTLPSKIYPALPVAGRSYTFDELEELRYYAKARGIVLVPEIEMPGHARSLVEAYPHMFANHFDEKEQKKLITENGEVIGKESVICVGSDEVFGNITKLIDEVIEMFPDSPYIHLGADEVNTEVWKHCPLCRKYMEHKQIDDSLELYADFVARITDYVLEKGKRPIVWEGVSKRYNHKISKDVIVIGWECHYQNPDELIHDGFEVINCSWRPLYMTPRRLMSKPDQWNEVDILKWNVYEWQHWWQHSEATLNPFHLPPTDQVIGAQLCQWEMTYECGISALVMRLAALSERTWSLRRYCSDDKFWEKLGIQMDKLFRLIV